MNGSYSYRSVMNADQVFGSSGASSSSKGVVGGSNGSSAPTTSTKNNTNTCSLVSSFSDDIIVYILGFVSDVPYESSTEERSSMLTHELPLVSKQFARLCKDSDYLWKSALQRIAVTDLSIGRQEKGYYNPSLWKQGLLTFIAQYDTPRIPSVDSSADLANGNQGNGNDLGDSNSNMSMNTSPFYCPSQSSAWSSKADELYKREHKIVSHLLTQAYEHAQNSFAQHNPPPVTYSYYRHIYKWILGNFIRFTSPLFHMRDPSVRIGQDFGLHFFEDRYQTLIAEVMQPFSEEDKKGFRPIRPLPVMPSIQIQHSRNHNESASTSTSTRSSSTRSSSTRSQINSLAADPANQPPPILPTFIYSNNRTLTPGNVICLVQVRQCRIHPNGTADVMLRPVSYARIERVWRRNTSENLFEARVNRLSFPEAVQHVHDMFVSMGAHERDLGEIVRQWLLGAWQNRE